jgi:hypothetical protein
VSNVGSNTAPWGSSSCFIVVFVVSEVLMNVFFFVEDEVDCSLLCVCVIFCRNCWLMVIGAYQSPQHGMVYCPGISY